MNQLSLIPTFDGATFDSSLDGPRLTSQLGRVKALMLDGRWHSLAEIAGRVGGSEAGVSARLRDLRKPRNGGWNVERQRVDAGLWEYRATVPRGTNVSC